MAKSWEEILASIREAVLNEHYVLTPHAWQEMREDDLTLPDIETALLRGRIDREYENDPRGVRYRVAGPASDLLSPVGVILRFVDDDRILIITVYVIENHP